MEATAAEDVHEAQRAKALTRAKAVSLMPRGWHACSTPICPTLIPPGVSRCPGCSRTAEQRRGTPTERGYGRAHRAFRRAVLRRDPTCVIDGCGQPSEHADHHPHSLRELRTLGLDPYQPSRGRGLCQRHHSTETARSQPGGWAAR
jgi:5-methylcytosine-specific restriction protein A